MGALPTTELKGYELLRDKVEGALQLLQEISSIEFKKATKWSEQKIGITKDILAMTNLRGGGIIILGIEEKDNKWDCTGISDEELNTYNPDEVIEHVNKYASPSINFNVVKHTKDTTLNFLVIQVPEFEEKPVICKKQYNQELRKGALYIRPQGKPESREAQNADEVHDLLELAADKAFRKFLGKCENLGLITPLLQAQVILEKNDMKKFEEDLEGL